jgi:TolC family type I secretion outer membrane protein
LSVKKPVNPQFAGSALFLAMSLTAGVSVAAPLPDVVKQVLEAHPDIQSASALLDASAERIRQSRSEFLPSVGLAYEKSSVSEEASAVSTDRETGRLDATLKWNLFNGLADRHGVEAAEASNRASAADLEATREELALRVAESYLEVLKNQQTLQISAAHIQQLQKLVETVTTRAELGRISRVNIHQATTRLVQAQNRHFQLRAALSGGKLGFRQLTGQDATDLKLPELETDFSTQQIESLYQQAMANNPRLQAEKQRAKSRKADVGVAAAGLMPTVDLELRKRLFSDVSPDSSVDMDTSTRFMINYEIPLGGATFSRKREAIKRQYAATARIESVERDIKSSIGALYRQLLEERNIAPYLERNVTAAQEVVKAYHLQFNAGKRTLLDLLTAYSDLYLAEVSVLENKYSQLLSQTRLQNQLGTLGKNLLAGK